MEKKHKIEEDFTMKTLLKILCPAVMLTGCAVMPGDEDGAPSVDAGQDPTTMLLCESTGREVTWIKYGDARLSAKPVTKIKNKNWWQFRLQPEHNPETDTGIVNYENALVTITSKSPENNWLSASGRYADSPTLSVCIPDGFAVGTIIEFTINVQWSGTLDPRGVIN